MISPSARTIVVTILHNTEERNRVSKWHFLARSFDLIMKNGTELNQKCLQGHGRYRQAGLKRNACDSWFTVL